MAQRSAMKLVELNGAITVLGSFTTMEGGLPIEVAADILGRLELFANGQVATDPTGGKLFRTDVKAAATAVVITVQVVYRATKDISVFRDACKSDAEATVFAILDEVLEAHDLPDNRALGKPAPEKENKKDDKSGGKSDKDDQNGGGGNSGGGNRPRRRT